MFPLSPRTPPLRQTDDGAIRIGGTRVSLDSVQALYAEGASAEQVADSFPTLDLADIYETFAYLRREPDSVAAYLEARREEADRLRLRGAPPMGRRLADRRGGSRRERRGNESGEAA